MGFYKKVLVLKQTEQGFSVGTNPLSAICRIEIENGVGELVLTCLNFAIKPNLSYKLMLVDDKNYTFTFDCGKKPSVQKFPLPVLPSVVKGITIGIYAVMQEIPLTVAFACEDDSNCPLSEFKRLVAEKCILERKNLSEKNKPLPIKEPEDFPSVSEPEKEPEQINLTQKTKTVEEIYNDEAVATANYYEFEQQIDQKLFMVKELEDERLRLSNVKAFNSGKEKANVVDEKTNFTKNETDVYNREEYSENFPYYKTVKSELDAVFSRFPEENGLNKLFPQSKWCKINYSKEKFYVVGLIKENQKEKYICYGVPGKYSLTPPKELKGYCTFIPLSIFDLSGDGYWMMFQDAFSGECIKPKPPFDS